VASSIVLVKVHVFQALKIVVLQLHVLPISHLCVKMEFARAAFPLVNNKNIS
jgi:hypothetical protein